MDREHVKEYLIKADFGGRQDSYCKHDYRYKNRIEQYLTYKFYQLLPFKLTLNKKIAADKHIAVNSNYAKGVQKPTPNTPYGLGFSKTYINFTLIKIVHGNDH